MESSLPGPVHLGVVGLFKGRRVKMSDVQMWENLTDIQSVLLKVCYMLGCPVNRGQAQRKGFCPVNCNFGNKYI